MKALHIDAENQTITETEMDSLLLGFTVGKMLLNHDQLLVSEEQHPYGFTIGRSDFMGNGFLTGYHFADVETSLSDLESFVVWQPRP